MCLQETKLAEIDLQLVRSLWGNSFVDWEMLPVTGTAGGVLLLWDRRVLEKLDFVVCQFSVSYLWKTLTNGMEWVGTGFYGPTIDELRHGLWDELRSVRQKWGLPWYVFGDFNVFRFPSERRGCIRLTSHMMDFSDFIEESHLVDLPLGGSNTPGVVVQKIRPYPGLTGFLFLLTGRIAILICLKSCYLALYRIITLFCWSWGVCCEVRFRLDLKICG